MWSFGVHKGLQRRAADFRAGNVALRVGVCESHWLLAIAGISMSESQHENFRLCWFRHLALMKKFGLFVAWLLETRSMPAAAMSFLVLMLKELEDVQRHRPLLSLTSPICRLIA